MRYMLFLVGYLVFDILSCYVVNLWIRNWLLRRTYEKWGVDRYPNMTDRQQDWFETRQTIYESAWDMIISIIIVIVMIHVCKLDIQ